MELHVATTFLVGLLCARLQGSRVLFQFSSNVGPADPGRTFLVPRVWLLIDSITALY